MTTLLLLLGLIASVYSIETITLTPNNVATMRGVIDEDSASQFISKLLALSDENVYIYLTTPGGSVLAGYQIVETMDMLRDAGKKVHCIADVANSMGFVILQSCEHRYVRQSSVIMQHQMQLMNRGALEQVMERMRLTKRLEQLLAQRQADRLGLTLEDFKSRVMNDWWIMGEDAVTAGAADEVVHVSCSPELMKGSHNETTQVLFFTVTEEYSDCPLIRAPLKRDGDSFLANADKDTDLYIY